MMYIGKKPAVLNLLFVKTIDDLDDFPMDVKKAIVADVVNGTILIDSLECGQEKVSLPAYIAWEKEDRCPNGYNLWVKSNAPEQLAAGKIVEENGHFRQAKVTVYKAEKFTGTYPKILEGLPTFPGQVTIDEEKVLRIVTPWGVSSCKPDEGYVVLYGIARSSENPKFEGVLDANILTVGTKSFDAYFVCSSEGKIIESLKEYHEKN